MMHGQSNIKLNPLCSFLFSTACFGHTYWPSSGRKLEIGLEFWSYILNSVSIEVCKDFQLFFFLKMYWFKRRMRDGTSGVTRPLIHVKNEPHSPSCTMDTGSFSWG